MIESHGLQDIFWVLICAALVLLMQGGFCCLESGLVRNKNSINVAFKNLIDFCIAAFIFWIFGFALMFGATQGGWIGSSGFIFTGNGNPLGLTFFIFQLVFCGTAITIVSGAVAERMRFQGYVIISLLTSGLIYPIQGHWFWAGASMGNPQGWLASQGFIDFAGATVVHSTGGWIALASVLVIGPRLGRFNKEGKLIQGHNLPLATLGVFLLWFGWFGFNGGSTLAFTEKIPLIITNTILSGAVGAVVAFGWSCKYLDKPEMVITMTGALAGLVGITGSCNIVTPGFAAIIGGVSGLISVLLTVWLEQRKIDDVVGAIPVHCGGGVWGTLAIPLMSDPESWGTGLSRWGQLAVQAEGVAICFFWAFGVSFILIKLMDRLTPLRVNPEDEIAGLNVSEHGASTALQELLTEMDSQKKSGDFSSPVTIEPHTEVGQIASQYNRVMKTVLTKENELEKLTNEKDLILNSVGEGIFGLDLEGNITFCNSSATRIFGYKLPELIGCSLHELLHHSKPDGNPYPKEECPVHGTLEKGFEHLESNEVFWAKNGKSYPVEYFSAPIRHDNQLVGAVVTIKDISARKLEEARQEMLFTLKRIFAESKTLDQSMPEILKTVGNFLHWDIAFFWNVETEDNNLKCAFGWRSPHILDSVFKKFEKTSFETRFEKGIGLPGRIWANAKPSWIDDIDHDKNFPRLPTAHEANIHSGFGFPIFSGKNITGIIEVFTQEITKPNDYVTNELSYLGNQIGQFTNRILADEAILKAKVEAEKAKDEAENANRAKSVFLSNMSHELRTPLNAILGYSDLLKGAFFGPLNDKQTEYASRIEASGKHLLELITDLLELSKIDAGKVELQLESFPPGELIDSVLKIVKPTIQKKKLEVESILTSAPATMTGDRRRCKQIMLNLLSNAIKYTPEEGEIRVTASQKRNSIQISVADTGIGISKDQQEKIFSEFHQVDQVRDENLGGTGIGLSLTRRLVELHGGEIGVESDSNGSNFWFNLPLKKLSATTETQTKVKITSEQTPSTHRRILVAEDNDVNLAMLLDMLSAQKHNVTVAKNGQEAVDLALSSNPELFILDIRMPIMDGLEAARKLRAMPQFSETPIIALTASVGDDSKEKCMEAGFTEHLAKPIQTKELFEALSRYF